MPRRYRPQKREIIPDPKFKNKHITMFVNRMMIGGKKSTARKVMYTAFDLIQERMGRDPVEVFELAITNATPMVEVKPRRVGGSTYQIPVEVDPYRRLTLAMRWLLNAARARSGRGMAERLANELMDAAQMQGAAIKRKEDVHKMAEANRTFSHFRF